MSALVSVVQNAGQVYSSYAQEIAKNISYFLPIDSATGNKTTNPFYLPDSGIIYSYEVYIRCRCDLAPVVSITNFKVWSNSLSLATGYSLTVNSTIVNTYEVPVNIESSRGTRIDFGDAYDEASSIALDGTLINIGDYTSWLVFQLELSAGADTGNFEAEYIIQYDEA